MLVLADLAAFVVYLAVAVTRFVLVRDVRAGQDRSWLSRRGNRRLNHAIHMAAVTQVSHRHSDGRAYYDKKLAEGKTGKVALRSLKRQISNAIFACLQADAARAAARAQSPGGQQGNDSVASAAGSHPERQLFGQATPGPVTTLRRPADQQKRASSHARKKTARTT